jgi:hypothetical protein
MFLPLSGIQSSVRVNCSDMSTAELHTDIVRVHYSDVSTAEWHTEYCTCTLQWFVYCWVAHRLLYIYTTVMSLLIFVTQCTVCVHYSDVSTAEWHILYFMFTLQSCVYSWVAHRLLYVYTTVMFMLLSGTQCTLSLHYSDVSTAELHTDYSTFTLQWYVYWYLSHSLLYVYTKVMFLLLSGTQCALSLHYSGVSTAEWHTDYCTCTPQWCAYCWVAQRVLYVYTTVMCLLLRGTQITVRVHYSDVSTAEWHTEHCTCTLQWYVYCWVAHRILYVYTTVVRVLLSGTQSTVRVHYSDVCTAEWHTEYCTCTLQWCVYCWVSHRVLYVYTTVMSLLMSGTQITVRVHYSDVCTSEWNTEYCTCTLQWCVYCWVAHRVL